MRSWPTRGARASPRKQAWLAPGTAEFVERGLERISEDARAIYEALPSDGSRVSNAKLRSRADLRHIDDDAYTRAKGELLTSKLVQAGVGRTGTLARVLKDELAEAEAGADHAIETAATIRGGVENESDLYSPFRSWLTSTGLAGGSAFGAAAITASGKGRVRAGGRWSRPDVTAVTVTNFELLPGATVEVSSYEIKRAADAERLESVFEAAAHGRWAHRASLVIERVDGTSEIDQEIRSEVERFGLGLYTMQRDSGGKWVTTELREPDIRQPDPQYVHDLLEYFLGLDEIKSRRRDYLQSLK
jgi:hypothetical protein